MAPDAGQRRSIRPAVTAGMLLSFTAGLSAQAYTVTIDDNVCQSSNVRTTATFHQRDACLTTTRWDCGEVASGIAIVSLPPYTCPGVDLTGILDPWVGFALVGTGVPPVLDTLTNVGCYSGNEYWQHSISFPAASLPSLPGVDVLVHHVLLASVNSGPLTWYADHNAVKFTLSAAPFEPLLAWGVPPAHVYSNDGRSTGSTIRIPALAYRHVNDGGVGHVRFTLTHPNSTQTTQDVFTRTVDTPTASTTGSPFVTTHTDRQSQLSAFFFSGDASQLADGLYELRAEVIDSNGTTVLASIEDMSFWNDWGGSAITYVDRYVDYGAGNDSNSGLAPASAVKTIHGGLVSVLPGGGEVTSRSGTASAQFVRLHLVGSAKQSWGGRTTWQPSFGTHPATWIEVIGEGATPDGNVLVQEPTDQGTGQGGVSLGGSNGVAWVHFLGVTIDDDWGLDYANSFLSETRGWYDDVTMQPGVYGSALHAKAITFRQGLDGFHWRYGTNLRYRNTVNIDTFHVGSDIVVEGALMQSAGRFADNEKPHVHWGVEVPKQTAYPGEVLGTFEPFNSSDWPWNQSSIPQWAGYSNVQVTATPMGGSVLRVSIPSSAPNAAQFLAAGQALDGLTGIGMKIRHSNATYTGYVAGLNDGDWEVVGAGTQAGDPYVDLDMGATTPALDSGTSITLKTTWQSTHGWEPAGFDPHPDILELQVPQGRTDTAPPIIVQGFRAYDVRNAQLLFTHGGDLINTAFVNCAIGTTANQTGVLNTGSGFFRMHNFIFRNNYIPGSWSLQFDAGTFTYTDVEVTNNIFSRITSTTGVIPTTPAIYGHFHFQTNRMEAPTGLGQFGELDNSTYTFTWNDPNRGDTGDFTNVSSIPGLGPTGFALDGSDSGS